MSGTESEVLPPVVGRITSAQVEQQYGKTILGLLFKPNRVVALIGREIQPFTRSEPRANIRRGVVDVAYWLKSDVDLLKRKYDEWVEDGRPILRVKSDRTGPTDGGRGRTAVGLKPSFPSRETHATVREAAEFLGVDRHTVKKWCTKGWGDLAGRKYVGIVRPNRDGPTPPEVRYLEWSVLREAKHNRDRTGASSYTDERGTWHKYDETMRRLGITFRGKLQDLVKAGKIKTQRVNLRSGRRRRVTVYLTDPAIAPPPRNRRSQMKRGRGRPEDQTITQMRSLLAELEQRGPGLSVKEWCEARDRRLGARGLTRRQLKAARMRKLRKPELFA